MDKTNRIKTALKGKITRVENSIQNMDPNCELAELKVKLKGIDTLQKKVDELRSTFYDISDIQEEDLTIIEQDLDQCEDRLEKLEVGIQILIDSYNKSNPVKTVDVTENDTNGKFEIKTKIPPLVLPVFSGKYEEFSSFKNQFDDLITNNSQLSQSQKLYYLRSCLVHDAKHLASNFDNFESLYESLKLRYDNERLIVDIHAQSILNFEKMHNESAGLIRSMIDCVQKNLRALNVLKYERNKLFDIFLINILVQKLDRESKKNFELSHKGKNVPTFDEFISFLEQRESVLISINRNVAPASKPVSNKNFPTSYKPKVLLINENKNKNCIICKNPHPIYRCDIFLKMSVDERVKSIRLHKLCEICLKQNHKKSQCLSHYRCNCGEMHSRLICGAARPVSSRHSTGERSNENNKNLELPDAKKEISQSNASALSNISYSKASKKKSILFSTAEIYVQGADKQTIKIRAILDSASNICVLSEKMSKCLGIKKERIKRPVSGLNGLSQNIKWKLNTCISNQDSTFTELVEFLIVDKVTGLTPCASLDISEVKIPKFLKLADSSFYEASEIHALISADILFKALKHNSYKINNELSFQESEFGWIACGKLNEIESTNQGQCFLAKNDSLQDTLRLFFDLEGLGIRDDPVIQEKDQAMEIFKETTEFKNGRYVVELPFRKPYEELADNYSLAKLRFQNLWRRFSHDPELHQQYREIIRDYLEQGIIEEVNTEIMRNPLNKPVYYLPHQAVKKESSLTSKTRIVFDAGSHQNDELSLNDCLWPGSNLNPNLLDILINFRLNRTAFCSDVKQAFLQICLSDKHKDAVRFLWSNDEQCICKRPKMQIYRFNRVNFGVSSSPFLLAATIRHHIKKYMNEYPETVRLLDSCFYVDDLISGSNNFEEALEISRNAKSIMEAAGMSLRKWVSNDINLMKQWRSEKFDTYSIDATGDLGSTQTKVLGMSWDTYEDYLTMNIRSLLKFVSVDKCTKRFILQSTGKIFDPLGLISPFTVRMKCLIQKLWDEEIPWDEKLPPNIEREWKEWCSELPFLEELKIPRLVLDSTCKEDLIEIHSFCDASKKAYGAAIYLKLITRDGVSVKLVASKSRVAPLKGVTLPRLELLGALVAARLAVKVKGIVNLKGPSVEYHWTDSKITLFWIKGTKNRWKQFVANRVKEITDLTDASSWFHCSGKENPADLLSRGMNAGCLVASSKWWTGAEFLLDPEPSETSRPVVPGVECLTETERESFLREIKKGPGEGSSSESVLLTDDSCTIFNELLNFSNNYYKIIHVLSYIFRFSFNCRNQRKKIGPLTSEEIRDAELKLIKHEQRLLHSKKGLPSNISNLFPFIDENGIVRVGGRLENSCVPYSQKHPPIVPKGSKLSKVLFDSLHRRLLHVGPQGLLNAVRLRIWPLQGRDLARKTVHQCVTCFKSKPILSSQIMGNLPSGRVNTSPPFNITGLDLCGPYLVKYKNQRKGTLNKLYVCVCICFSTKAMHLETLTDLTSDALIATLKRFTSRRGICSKVYTDNATNFVGANSKLKDFYKLVNFPDGNLAHYFVSENIDWNFIPPKSPHFGGLWEAGVKSVKHHIKRTIGDFHFTYEEFETILIQVEGILNSRPLTPLSNDFDNFEVLTPGHFLIGRAITAIPEPFLIDIKENRLRRWQKTTKVVQLIWKKWKLDYLNTLQARSKWKIEKNDVMIGQMVVVKEDFLPISKWLLGRITDVYPGTDGKVRVVKVRTKSGEFKRTINKVAVLPIET